MHGDNGGKLVSCMLQTSTVGRWPKKEKETFEGDQGKLAKNPLIVKLDFS